MNMIQEIFNKIDHDSFNDIFEHCIDPVIITDANWKDGLSILYVNRAFCNVTGFMRKELIGKNPKIFQGTESNEKVIKELKTELIKGNNFIGQSINYKKDGSSYIVKWSISPLKDKNNNIIGYISFQKSIERKVQLKHEKLLSSIVNISNNLILVTDLEGVIVYINKAFSEKLGYEKEELIGKHSRVLKSGKQDDEFYKLMWNSILSTGKFSDIFISKKKDGTLFYDKKEISTIKDDEGNPTYYVSISKDISKQIKDQEYLQSQIYKDQLTQIYNRKKYEEVIEQKISDFEIYRKEFCLVLIDLDHFKEINDNYGHDVGDYILQEFAKLIKQNLRSDDMFFRWGGEEFALIVDSNKYDTYKLVEKLREVLSKKSFQSITITASFGIGQICSNCDKNSLFMKTDDALYKAKNSGRDKVVVYE